jgi:hypothetical protein
MATKFKLKRSTIGGIVPTTVDIDTAELAVNLADKKLYTSNGTVVFEIGSNLTNLSVSGNLTINTIIANGSIGTAGQVLHSNGTSVYWDTDDQGVTSVASGVGLSGGTITNTGTISVLANNGITANTTGIYVTQGTGTVVNATGVHVNSAYIETLTVNNSTNLDGQPATFYTNATNITTGTLATARLPATANISTAINIGANALTVGTSAYFVANGNVGIGNSTPISKLQVTADINAAIFVNPTVITTSYTIPNNHNAGSFGPITVGNGAIVTVPAGSTWSIV